MIVVLKTYVLNSLVFKVYATLYIIKYHSYTGGSNLNWLLFIISGLKNDCWFVVNGAVRWAGEPFIISTASSAFARNRSFFYGLVLRLWGNFIEVYSSAYEGIVNFFSCGSFPWIWFGFPHALDRNLCLTSVISTLQLLEFTFFNNASFLFFISFHL